ncbi:MAG TPA: carbohydrate ABC transporter permease [Thermomicrobiales bacterium]|nr:carbohydrate ABC transporter permease [Thermomicrobiales bacterium]
MRSAAAKRAGPAPMAAAAPGATRTRQRLLVRLPIFLALLAIAATTVYPLLFLAFNALKERTEYAKNVYGLPRALNLANFQVLVENYDILRAVANSLFVTAIAVVVSVLLSALTSFVLAKVPFRGQRAVFGLIVGVLLVPAQVLLIPVYLLFSRLGLVNNALSVILIYTALALPFGTFLLTSSFRAIPNELIESARLDGASLGTVFRTVIVPLGRPAILTLAVLSFLSMWNELLLGMMLLPDQSKRLLTPTIALLLGRLLTNQPLLMAGLLISSLPTVLLLIIFSRYLVRGITLGFGR